MARLHRASQLFNALYPPSPQAPALPSTETTAPAPSRLEDLEDRLDRLALINMAMWSLLRQQTQLTEEDLMNRVQEIDLLDGQADGRVTRQVLRCAQCGRVMSPRHRRCLYCGHQQLDVTAFDSII